MNDPLLLSLAKPALDCYAAGANFVWQGEDKTSHLLHTVVNDILTFTFEGTSDLKEWVLDAFAVPLPVPGVPEVGDLHVGFSIGTLDAIQKYIFPTLSALGFPPFYLSGHSKGAAQAGQAHVILKSMGHCPLATRLYEPPLFGGEKAAELMQGDDVEWTQTFNSGRPDIVTTLPMGPSWKRHKSPIRLQVSDTLDLIEMHKMQDRKSVV